jgi:hypothetical protein
VKIQRVEKEDQSIGRKRERERGEQTEGRNTRRELL